MVRCDILMYHMVSEPQTSLDARFAIPPQRFAAQIDSLLGRGYHFVSLDQILGMVNGQTNLPDRSVAITFDDGYLDNYENAFPILQQRNIPAAIFLVSGLMGDSNRWMHGRGFSERALMNWPQVREMASHRITFGGHTVNHARLTEVSADQARREIEDNRAAIADRLGTQIDHFAYPYGALNETAVKLVREAGYRTACSTRPGPNRADTNPYVLRRIEVYGDDTPAQLHRKLVFGTNERALTVPLRYYWDRLKSRLPGN
ncbi:MAG: polysaccharide deacetylase family protein [Chromatiales bacterium]|nr:polysaccharide deacetylase family protein [Chromatiales bacterium]